jgi:hypothetical protein
MFGEGGQGGSVKPLYQILMEWKRKQPSTNPDPILNRTSWRLAASGFRELARWIYDDPQPPWATTEWEGGMLFEGLDLEEYYYAIRELRDSPVVDLDGHLQCKFIIGRMIYTGISYEFDPGPSELILRFNDEGRNLSGTVILLVRWRTLAGNLSLAQGRAGGRPHSPPLGKQIVDRASEIGFKQVSYNLTAFSDKWDGWRLLQGEGEISPEDFETDVIQHLDLNADLRLEVSVGQLSRPDPIIRTVDPKDVEDQVGRVTDFTTSVEFRHEQRIPLIPPPARVFAYPIGQIPARGAIIRPTA